MKFNLKKYTNLFTTLLIIIFITSCSQSTKKEDQNLVSFEDEKEQINEFLTEKKSDLDDAINELEKTAEVQGERASENVEIAIEELKEKRSMVVDKMKNVAESGKDDWQNVKTETEKLIRDIDSRLETYEKNLTDDKEDKS